MGARWSPLISALLLGPAAISIAAEPAMTERDFWSLISLIQGDPSDDQRSDIAPLALALSQRSAEEIQGFFDQLTQRLHALDTRAHYRAFALKSFPFILPGRADDFLYARLGVVARGAGYYRSVLESPRLVPGSWTAWNEDLLHVADLAYQARTGKTFPRESVVDFESFTNQDGWR